MKVKARKSIRAGDVIGKRDLVLIEPDGRKKLVDPLHWIKYARKTAKSLIATKKELSEIKRTII